jgi:hypothetical protein
LLLDGSGTAFDTGDLDAGNLRTIFWAGLDCVAFADLDDFAGRVFADGDVFVRALLAADLGKEPREVFARLATMLTSMKGQRLTVDS